MSKPFRVRRRGVEAKLVVGVGSAQSVDPVLIDNLARAWDCHALLKDGRSLDAIAERHQVSRRRVRQLLSMAFLAPDIVRDILRGDQPVGLTSEWLQRNALPDDWSEQRRIVSRL